MILSAQSIRYRCGIAHHAHPKRLVIEPFCERTVHEGMSYGLSSAGYDIRVLGKFTLLPGDFGLATTIEYIGMPPDLRSVITAPRRSTSRRAPP